jgi:RND family efflux transporter MFP subunit
MKKLTHVWILAAVLIFFTSCGSEEAPKKEYIRPVKTLVVGSVTNIAGQGFPATTKASQESKISFRVGGQLIKMNVIEGARVKKGELVAEIDPRDYKIAEQAARAQYNQTKAEAERYKRLWEKGSVAKNDYDRKQANHLISKAKWEDAVNDLKDTRLYAPFTGYYGAKLADVGTEVRAKQPVTTLSNLKQIEVTTTIPEQLAVKFKSFKSYEVILDAFPGKVYKARLKEMGKVPTPEGYTLQLYLDHINKENNKTQTKITAGMSCRVNINLSDAADDAKTVTIPFSAVFEGETDDTPSVWILKDSDSLFTVKKQPVKLNGFVGKNYVLVVDGLKSGDKIVTAGTKRLVENQKVKLLDQNAFK